TPDKQVKYNLSSPVSAELKASPLAVYIGKTEVTVTASNVESSGKYTLYKGENEVLSGTSQEGKDITFTDKDFTTEGFLTYKIVLTNGLCSAEDYATVDVIRGGGDEPEPIVTKVIEPMFFFTPNGDGLNDNWIVKNIEGYGYYVVEIYDRYGRCLVKATDSYKPFMWDGTYNGHEMPNDDYWFIITIQEGDVRKQRSGHFRLRR
ncbi:MAG: T9SS type B sorting domain-containing protein, partial [Paludibacteraceae bacterium]|nr:T9SS type B sorting domain-containing protein [Paludibacteraceae bacterium]